MGGDFNHTDLNGLDRKTSAATQNDVSDKTLKELCNSIRLVDIWRQMHPNKQQFTYKNISRIDKFLASENCTNCIQQALITPAGIKTDHKAVFLHDGPDLRLFILVGWDRSFCLLLGPPGLN